MVFALSRIDLKSVKVFGLFSLLPSVWFVFVDYFFKFIIDILIILL